MDISRRNGSHLNDPIEVHMFARLINPKKDIFCHKSVLFSSFEGRLIQAVRISKCLSLLISTPAPNQFDHVMCKRSIKPRNFGFI